MWQKENHLAQVVTDFLIFFVAIYFAQQILPVIEQLGHVDYRTPNNGHNTLILLTLFPVLVVLFHLADLYRIRRQRSSWQVLQSLVLVFTIALFTFTAFSALVPTAFAPLRKLVLVTSVFALVLFWLFRVSVPSLYFRPLIYRRVLLIGAHSFALRSLLRYGREHTAEVEILGILDDFKRGLFFEGLDIPYLGTCAALPQVLENYPVDTLVVLHDQSEYSLAVVEAIAAYPQIQEVYVRAQIPLFMAQDIEILFVQEVPLLKVYARLAVNRNYWMRNAVDRLLAAVGLLLASPIFAIVPLLIKLESRGPAFYQQVRLGRHNRPFSIVKFRSMHLDAESRSGAVLATRNDPRVTTVGRLLRATRLDEVPQLLNVLWGDMSMIGPRPERPEFQNIYADTIPWYPLRALTKPGITGLAQVCGEYDTSTQRKLLYDVTYLANISPLLDLRILLGTVVTVLTKGGH